MSATARDWAWMQELRGDLKVTLLALADVVNSEGVGFPNKRTLLAKTGLSRSGLIRHTRKLERLGFVTVVARYRENGSQTSNEYHLALGGCHHVGTPPVSHIGTPPVSTGGTPLYEPIKEPYIGTNTGEPGPEENVGTVKEVFEKNKPFHKDAIIFKAKREEGILTPAGCAYIWRHFRRTAGASGFQAEILQKELAFLKKAHSRLGEKNYIDAVWAVMNDWIAFTKFAQDKGGAYQLPQTPKIEFFLKFCAEAVEFAAVAGVTAVPGWVQPIAKPLTTPEETVENGETAMSHEDVLAINKEFDD